MAADVVVKMKTDTSKYDGGLAKAKKKLDEFVKSNGTMNGLMGQGINMLTKFAGGFAAAELAIKGFNKVIMEGSQTTGDFVRNGLGAMNDTIGVLASSIATMDFSAMTNGLGEVYKHALAARESLDSLGDTLRGLGLAGDEARQAVAELQEVNKNAASTSQEQAAALKKAQDAVADYKETIKTATKETNSWIDENVKAQSGFKYIKTTADDVKKLTINYGKMGKAAKDAYKARAAAAQEEYASLKSARSNLDTHNEMSYANTTLTFNPSVTHKAGGTEEQKKAADAAIREYETANKDLLQAYVLFEKNSDAEMDDMAQKVRDIAGYSTQAAQMQKRLDQAMNTKAEVGVSSGSAKSGGSAVSGGYKSQLDIPSKEEVQAMDISTMMRGLDASIPSMQSLVTLAGQLQKQMNETADSDVYNSLAAQYEKVKEAIAVQPLAIKNGITIDEAKAMESLKNQWDEMQEQFQLSVQATVELNIKKAEQEAQDLQAKTEKNKATWNAVASSVSSVGSALQSVDNKGLNIAGTVMQAVADIALGFAMMMANPQTAALGPWGWIAAAAAGLATMTAMIASIKAQTSGSYASGGIVPGAYNGGIDSTYVYASPGELILNRAQQENLLGQMDEGTDRGGAMRCVVTGEQLVIAANNYGRRTGKGELLFR